MIFVSSEGKVIAGRRSPYGTSLGLGPTDVTDPAKLSQELTELKKRLSEIEAILPPASMEFEQEVVQGGTYRLHHGFNGPIRWWVTNVCGLPEALVATPDSDNNHLVLQSNSDGDVVVRVEKSQYRFTTCPAEEVGGADDPTVIASYDFAAQTQATVPSGWTFARNCKTTVQTSPNFLDVTYNGSSGVDVAVYGNRTSDSTKRGLVIEANQAQESGYGIRAINAQEHPGASVTYTSPSDSPDGLATGCTRAEITAGGYTSYQDFNGSINDKIYVTGWWKSTPTTGTHLQTAINLNVENTGIAVTSPISAVWLPYYVHSTSSGTIVWASQDSRNFSSVGGFTQSAKDVYLDYLNVRIGEFACETIVGTVGDGSGVGSPQYGGYWRRADRLSLTTGSGAHAADGQIKFYASFSPKFSSSMAVNFATTAATGVYRTQAKWYIFQCNGTNNYAYIDGTTKKLHVRIAGGTEQVSLGAMSFAQHDVVTVFIAIGAGVASVAKYKLNSGLWIDMVLPTVPETPAFSTNALFVFINGNVAATATDAAGDTGSFPCRLHMVKFYNTGDPTL